MYGWMFYDSDFPPMVSKWKSLRKISRRSVGNLKFVLKDNGYGSNGWLMD